MFLAVHGGNADVILQDYPVIAYKIKVDETIILSNILRLLFNKLRENIGIAKMKDAQNFQRKQLLIKLIEDK